MRSVYLVKADGTAVSSHPQPWFAGAGGEPLNPGDAAVVLDSFGRFDLIKELKDRTQILYQLALGVVGSKVLGDISE